MYARLTLPYHKNKAFFVILVLGIFGSLLTPILSVDFAFATPEEGGDTGGGNDGGGDNGSGGDEPDPEPEPEPEPEPSPDPGLVPGPEPPVDPCLENHRLRVVFLSLRLIHTLEILMRKDVNQDQHHPLTL